MNQIKNNIRNKTKLILFAIISVLQTNCSFKDENTVAFRNDLAGIGFDANNGTENRSNLFKEWSVSDDRIECLVSKENRNLKLITRQLGNQKGTLEMKVRVGFFNQTISYQNKNWAGFYISPKVKNLENSDSGIKIGVCTNGALFMGEPSPNHINEAIIKVLPQGLDLKIVVTPIEDYYTINLSAFDVSTGEILANISKNYITKDRLVGRLELVSNFENTKSDKTNNSKSVWFEDWEIKGSKVNQL
jgi:hypothetical protein